MLTWDPATRFMEMRAVEASARVDGPMAEALCAKAAEWVGSNPAPFRILVDVANVTEVDAEWRAEWADFFRTRRAAATIAWCRANPLLRIIIRMFVLGTRVHGRAFATEAEARGWLEAQGGELRVQH